MKPVPTLEWRDDHLVLLDQRLLPSEEVYLACRSTAVLAEAIRTLAVRGAPAIGIAAAYGAVIAAMETPGSSGFVKECSSRLDLLASTRPTAVNLFYCLDIQREILLASKSKSDAVDRLLVSAQRLFREDLEASRIMGSLGADLLPESCTVLTHCNAGGLATAGLGTALSVIYEAHSRGILSGVYADETRPLLQGARLTSWELQKAGIPVKVLPDSAAASLLLTGAVDAVITGADRIAMNGDSANKIGTYPLALAAFEAGVPFYIVAPVSTFDPAAADGGFIEIEERGREELAVWGGKKTIPDGVGVYNPAFDVTPVRLITSIICEKGVISAPNTIEWRG
ncbi:MAG: S-methyl-5-thioribose-1-phosphate isomerase [Candidatus Fermentibacteraceae bacterium]|nr:S-methyl-5-thioribose-1-phosphate isomerase [Candidatus Fermentibacteraceae bacterium]